MCERVSLVVVLEPGIYMVCSVSSAATNIVDSEKCIVKNAERADACKSIQWSVGILNGNPHEHFYYDPRWRFPSQNIEAGKFIGRCHHCNI